MKNRTLPLSLLIGAALTIPSLAMAAPTNTATAQADTQAADMQAAQTASANAALDTQAPMATGEQGANQSSPFAINETQRISRASGTNSATSRAMPTDVQTQQQDMQLLNQSQGMQDADEALLQNQDSEGAMSPEEDMVD